MSRDNVSENMARFAARYDAVLNDREYSNPKGNGFHSGPDVRFQGENDNNATHYHKLTREPGGNYSRERMGR